MPDRSVLERLLDEMARGVVAPERYSTKSLSGRVEQLVLTTMLAAIAIVAGMLLGGVAGPASGGTIRAKDAGIDPAPGAVAVLGSTRSARRTALRRT